MLRCNVKLVWLGSFLVLMFLVSLGLLTGCGGNSSTPNDTGNTPPANPQPSVASLSPSSQNAGGAAFTLTLAGENFISSSTVQWNGSPRPTTYVSSSQLQALITASDIATAGTVSVSVTNPSPGGGNSGATEFTINSTSNLAPTLSSLSPTIVNAGTSGFILTVRGANFVSGSTIEWNGTALLTTYLSDAQLEAVIPDADLATSGFADITVANPAPGGGTSASLFFTVAYTPMVVNQLTNDLVWDSAHQLIYLSVPSLAVSNGNTVLAMDPTGNIQSSQFAGSEPDVLAISDDDQYLYAALDGASSVQRFTLPGLVPDINYSIGAVPQDGPTFAVGMDIAPGLSHTTAVARGTFNSSPYALGGLAIYDDGTQRPKVANAAGSLYDSLQWGSDTTIYANNSEVTSFDFYVLNASANGVTQSKDYQNEFSEFGVAIHYDSGTKLVYTDDGYVINPSNGQQVGSFPAAGLMIPDSSLNRAFFLGQTDFQSGTSNVTIAAFDLTTFAPVAEAIVPNVEGNPLHLIRWGANGLAFNDGAGFVYILTNPFTAPGGKQISVPQRNLKPVQRIKCARKTVRLNGNVKSVPARNSKSERHLSEGDASNPVPIITTLNPSGVLAGINGFTLSVNGSNFVSFSTVDWNGSPLPTVFVSGTELQAQISTSDVFNVGSASITVATPSPGGGTSNSLPLTIVTESQNPIPSILSLFPNSAVAGSGGLTLDVNGFGFTPSSVVKWNGSPIPSSFNDSGQLQVQVTAADLATPGYPQITVITQGPGGGVSNVFGFQVLYEPTIVNQVTNDMVWDPLNQVIYISVPGSASAHADQICILNPATAKIGTCQSAGSEPDVLAISDDSQFLYVGEDGTGSVQRFVLPGLTPDISYSLGNLDGTPYFALDLQVAPSAPHTTAVSEGILNLDPSAQGGITIFDDATPRPKSAPGWGFPNGKTYDSIQWGTDATELYAADTENETTGFDFYTLAVSSSGVALNQDYASVFWNPGAIHYDRGNGLIYSDDGFHVVNPLTGLPVGIVEVGGGWPMAPDSTLNTVFVLGQYVTQENSNYTVHMFDMTHFTLNSRIPFSTVQDGLQRLGRFIRWGTNGLALNDTGGNIYLFSGSFVSGNQESGLGANSPKPIQKQTE